MLFRCDDGEWCCSSGSNSTSCCNDPDVNTFQLRVAGLISGGHGFAPGLRLTNDSNSSDATKPDSCVNGTQNNSNTTENVFRANGTQNAMGLGATACNSCSAAKKSIGLSAGLGTGLPLLSALAAVAVLYWRQRRTLAKLGAQQVSMTNGHAAALGPTSPMSIVPVRTVPQRSETERSKPWVMLSRSELAHDDSAELSAIG